MSLLLVCLLWFQVLSFECHSCWYLLLMFYCVMFFVVALHHVSVE